MSYKITLQKKALDLNPLFLPIYSSKEKNMSNKSWITEFEKSQIMGFKKWLSELKNRFKS